MTTVYIIILSLLGWASPEGSTSSYAESAHEFHLSKSTIKYNTQESAVQITMNLFIDDLEMALLADYGADSLFIATGRESLDAEEFIHRYISDRLSISIAGEQLQAEFLGKEQSDDLEAIWCYLEVLDINSFDEIDVENTIMTDLFEDQKNMTTFKINSRRVEDIIFTTDKTSQHISFDD